MACRNLAVVLLAVMLSGCGGPTPDASKAGPSPREVFEQTELGQPWPGLGAGREERIAGLVRLPAESGPREGERTRFFVCLSQDNRLVAKMTRTKGPDTRRTTLRMPAECVGELRTIQLERKEEQVAVQELQKQMAERWPGVEIEADSASVISHEHAGTVFPSGALGDTWVQLSGVLKGWPFNDEQTDVLKGWPFDDELSDELQEQPAPKPRHAFVNGAEVPWPRFLEQLEAGTLQGVVELRDH